MFGGKRHAGSAPVVPPHKKQRLMDAGTRDPATGAAVVTQPHHVVRMPTRPVYAQTIMTPKPNPYSLDNTAYFSFILENSSAGAIDDATIRFEVKFASGGVPTDSRVLPVTQWFERIEFYERLSGQELARYYGDVLHLLMNTLSQEALSSIADMLNQDKYGRPSSRTWRSGDVQHFYLPLIHLVINGTGLDLSHLKGDLEIRFYPRGSIFVENQSALAVPCTETLEEVRLISSCTLMPNGLLMGKHPDKIGKVVQHRYLDYVQFVDHGRDLKANSQATVDLDQFSHNSGCLFVYLRRSGLQGGINYYPQAAYETGGRLFVCDGLGDQATIDLHDVQGRSQLGQGQPVNERYFREHTSNELFNEVFAAHNNVYVIPFSNDLRGMLDGEMDGFKHFKGERERLVLNPGPAPVETTLEFAPSVTITTTANNRVTIRYDGVILAIADIDADAGWTDWASVSGSQWHYRGDDAAAWTEINKMLASNSYLKSKGLKISLAGVGGSAAFANGNVTATFTDLSDQPLICGKDDLLKLTISHKDTGATAVDQVDHHYLPRTYVRGKRGFRDGIYDIYVYSAFFRHLREGHGRLQASAVHH